MSLALVALVLVGSAALSAVAVYVSIRISHRLGVYDHPDAERKAQERPIPRLGGVAVAVAFTVSVTVGLSLTGPSWQPSLALGMLIPALGAAVVGFLDDRSNLNPYLRLVLQAGLAALAWFLGTQLSVFGVPWLDFAVFVAWVVVVVNGVNLLDNSDGLAGATVLVASAGAGVIALMYGQELVSLMAFSLVGVAIGFLWHNWFPARVYLGDSGAYFLGFMLALLTVRLRPDTASGLEGAAIAILLVLLPIVDTTFVVIKRLRSGVHPFTAGRDHLSHAMQKRGASVPVSVAALQLLLLAGVGGAVVIAALAVNP